MAKKKTVDALSSDELYALAQEKERQEHEAAQAAVREEIEALRAERRALIAEHKKAVNAVDAQIRRLGGRTRRGGGGRRAGNNVTRMVLDILTNGEASTQEIKAALSEQGVTANNLSQTLAYLKRTGRVTSPSRAVYALAK